MNRIVYQILPSVLAGLCCLHAALMEITGKGTDRDLLIDITLLLFAHYVRRDDE